MKQITCPSCGETFNIDESGYAAIVSQIKDKEFDKRIKQTQKELEEKQQSMIDNAVLKTKADADVTINELKAEIKALKSEHDKYIKEAKKEREWAVEKATRDQDEKITELKHEIEKKNLEYESSLKQKEEFHKEEMRHKDEEIAQYKEFKLQQSTKMVGESLERFCENEFNKFRATGFQGAYFEKDNNAKSGSKGDFIFRDTADGVEYISIMFEMKNENDETKTKHKNEDFFKELDKDRREKGCEYAVLVSMLEADNELYNTGIVDVSYRYDKMYVIRPQFFIPIITLLRNAARNTVEAKKELAIMQSKNIDVSTFEASLLDFKSKFSKNCENANKHFMTAITEIENTIAKLEAIKNELLASDKQMQWANDKLEALSIQKLTKNNPTMQQAFKEAGVDVEPKKGGKKSSKKLPFDD